MKKIFSAIALMLLAMSCSNDYTDWAQAEKNEQQDAQNITFAIAEANAIDYDTLTVDSVQLFVPTVVAQDGAASTYAAKITSADGNTTQDLTVNNNGWVSADDLINAINTLYGKAPVERVVPVNVTATTKISGESFLSTATCTIHITPKSTGYNEYIYELGDDSYWHTTHALRSPDFDGKYQGYYYLNGMFMFKANNNTGNESSDYMYDSATGKIVQGGTSYFPAVTGFHQITVDLTTMTYSLLRINSIGILGAFNGWGTDVDMAYNTSGGYWELTTTFGVSGELKFRANDSWDLSWGGKNSDTDFDNLTSDNGKNLTVEAGTYNIRLYISYEGANRVVFTKQ